MKLVAEVGCEDIRADFIVYNEFENRGNLG